MDKIRESGSDVGSTIRAQVDSNTRARDDSTHKVAVAVIVGSTLTLTGCGCVVVGGSLAITTASGALTMIGLMSGGAGFLMLAAAANVALGQMRASK